MRFDVGDLLHAGLDSLRHEQGFLFGGRQVGENLPHPLAIAVVAQDVAGPAIGGGAVNWHHGRAEFHGCQRPALL